MKIADTEILPPGAYFRFITEWRWHKGYDFDVWWVNLEVDPVERGSKDPKAGFGYAYRIRDRKISSRPSTGELHPTVFTFCVETATQEYSTLHDAVKAGDLNSVERLIQEGARLRANALK